LANAARKNGDFAIAAPAYETYVKLDPKDVDGYFGDSARPRPAPC
jgi:cytochrome c-type biogenesis protein CcmH/NrfG